jgi:transposase
VLGEFGDDRTRFASPQSRKNYAGTSPITRASGRSHIVLARRARNRRLADALDRWAFCSLTHSPGARAYYDQLRGRGKTTAKRCGSSPTAGPASSTPASSAASSTTKPPPGTT